MTERPTQKPDLEHIRRVVQDWSNAHGTTFIYADERDEFIADLTRQRRAPGPCGDPACTCPEPCESHDCECRE